jgi:hypothetical protein
MALSYDHLLKVQPEDFVVRLFKKERILTFKNVMRGATVASGLLIYNYYRIYSSISGKRSKLKHKEKNTKLTQNSLLVNFQRILRWERSDWAYFT